MVLEVVSSLCLFFVFVTEDSVVGIDERHNGTENKHGKDGRGNWPIEEVKLDKWKKQLNPHDTDQVVDGVCNETAPTVRHSVFVVPFMAHFVESGSMRKAVNVKKENVAR